MFGVHENSVVLYDAGRKQWLLFHRPVEIYTTQNPEAVVDTLYEVERRVNAANLQAAGFISYEAGSAFDPALVVHSPGDFPLLWFGVYREPEEISFPSTLPEDATALPWEPSVSDDEYRHALGRIKEYIQRGDTYQVNYSYRLQTPFAGDIWSLFVRMIHAQGYGYGAFVNAGRWAVCSASPELFFTLQDGNLISRPMKGTAPRGLWQADDLQQAAWLAQSEKNRAENIMIVDMVRNDMGRIAERASVKVTSLFDCEKYPTLWQMTSNVYCRTEAGLTDILRALFPAASITGAPKVRTMQIIAELENTPRRIYTGTIGFISPNKAQFNVAIRTVLVDRLSNNAEYGVGGGIVWDSEKGDELKECRTKANILMQQMPEFSLLETILWTPEDGYLLLDRHLARLAGSAAYFSRSIDVDLIRGRLHCLARELPRFPNKIRMVVPQDGEPILEVQKLAPLPQPYRIRLAKRPINSREPFLYHKTTHRHVYEEARAGVTGCDDVLLWNEDGEITESCIANVVVEKEGRFITPPVHSGLLLGVQRAFLLEQGKIIEEAIRIEDLRHSYRIYLINSVRGMWQISLIAE